MSKMNVGTPNTMTRETSDGPAARARGNTSRPLRVLHVQSRLNRGGAETWLMDVVRNANRDDMQIDACVTTNTPGAYDEEFERHGGRILRCPLGRNVWRFARQFEKMLKRENYDVVHTHFYYFSGIILRAACRAGVPKRIAHNHPAEDLKAGGILRACYAGWMRNWTRRYGNGFVGPTRAALESFWGPDWEADPAKRVIYNGVRIDRFIDPTDISKVRGEIDVPADAPLVLNVGRYVPHKRQGFLVDVAEAVLAEREDVYFLLIGAGDLKPSVEARARSKGLMDNIRFISGEPNIDRYYLSSDVFAFPSTNEGFGIVIAEAAAAGLRVVAQDIPGVREAAAECPDSVLLPVETPPRAWARTLLTAIEKPRMSEPDRQEFLKRFPFTIDASIESLLDLYHA